MSTTIISAYILIVIGIIIWALLIPKRRRVSPKMLDYITVFGGAFLFASCFINLVPHIFIGEDPYRFVTPGVHFKIAGAVMIGFLLQLLLEQLTKGAEHGHNHCPCCEEEEDAETHHHEHLKHEGHCHNSSHIHPMTGLMIGLCLHAFLEGMPLVDMDGDIHQGLLYGIVLHNIPIALVMISLFLGNGYRFGRSFLLLLIFAVMTPLGSIFNLYLIPQNEVMQSLIMGAVVGILLHVSVSILFDHDHNHFSWVKLALILMAFVAAYFTPGCPEIYPIF
ncbi:MAG: ZIP family metal transporter [Bacteroidales bacterium]|nr:ZIP family metal transporter [Candidatus Colimorpha merdihippi]MCQ2281740.1 ZIP family metal transporter [Bacteroidales bacterium]